ncbi:MAG: hypothetical protein KatS3mg091_847 [Patescibacteria group bacterium]|nr:MAG: hypothetical protein KatS3mg090_0980 [Patescibacteria group bacterium]GIW63735.1 MAG: hypothetical protein KatS3mg091_537 [Patescibacteria group bacterium]GIW64045.1 MAG: hypothetical protein KatS3mg091_847 [Patescibacteria group bacterium]
MSNIYTKLFLKQTNSNEVRNLFIIAGLVWLIFFSAIYFVDKQPSIDDTLKVEFVTVTNLTSSQAVVVYKTTEKTSSYVLYGPDVSVLDSKADDLIYKLTDSESYYHYVELIGLKPKTKYYYIISVGDRYTGKAENIPFEFETPESYLPDKIAPLVLKLMNNKEPVSGMPVLLEIKGFYSLSGITKDDGSLIIPMGLLFDEKTLTRKIPTGQESFVLKLLEGQGRVLAEGRLSGILSFSGALYITETYEFPDVVSKEKPLIIQQEKRSGSARSSFFLTYPKDNTVISELNPLIRGTGFPGNDVLVQIKGKKNIVYKLKVDSQGDWWVDLRDPLDVGSYSLSVVSYDDSGNRYEANRTFTITKQGESVLAEATESADTATPTPTPSQTPTEIIQPTATPALTPTPTEISAEPSPKPPVSGFNLNLVLFALSFSLIFSGLLYFFKNN